MSTDWIAELEAGATLVTASDRLSRHLHQQFAGNRLAAEVAAWERPDILPVGAFWRRLADRLQAMGAAPLAGQRLLSRAAVGCRWEQLVAGSFPDSPLLQVPGAARSALDAWQLCRDWQLDMQGQGLVQASATDPLDEARLLADWIARFEEECRQRNWLPEHTVAETVVATLRALPTTAGILPNRILLGGFIEQAPLQRAQWQALEELGTTLADIELPAEAASALQFSARDPHAEIQSMAAWVRERLEADPACSIAVVVPDLAARRDAIRRALREALVPSSLAAFDHSAPPFNISLGDPLSEQAVIRDALAWLETSSNRVDFSTAARLCRSPYLAPMDEAPHRFRLEAELRDRGYAVFSLRNWQYLAGRSHCPALATALERYREAVREASRDALPSEWARRFSGWLEQLGWAHPGKAQGYRGRTLDSNEYQAKEAWHGLLARMGELDPVLGAVTRPVALSWLRRFVGETLFQPKAAHAPVQVLGLFEVTGMRFDAAWVMGMDDDTLPASPRPNPFLPIALQREHGLPNSSAAREQAFAQQVFDGLGRIAPTVVFSFAAREKDADRRASPLLAGIPGFGNAPAAFETVAQHLFDARAEEQLLDTEGTRHPGGRVRGGMALLQNQSHCPFRAFAIHRLAAEEWPTPKPGPDARLRGLIVHAVLETLWQRWRTRSELARLAEQGELTATLRDTVTAVVNEFADRELHRWTPGLRELESARLVNVLQRWFERSELPRPDFTVIEIEGHRADGSVVETLVNAGPLQLRGKLDRVDRLADDSELVIDYKTGDAPKKNDFFGDRPKAPQLPAYVLARRQAGAATPAGIAVASLKTGRESLRGIMQVAGDDKSPSGIPGMENVAKTDAVDSWDDAIAHWETTIHALGENFAAGDARVDPLPGACDYCHLSLFCRIVEQQDDNAENDRENGDD